MDIPWDDVRLFLAVAEHGSLSAAARHLQLGQPTLSRRLAQLEERLGYDSGPRGVVRLTAPPGIAFGFVAPLAASLREALPDVQLQVLSTIRYMDLSRREADLALRIEPPTQKDLHSVASIELDNEVCAAPSYIAKLPPRPTLADIDWIGWAPPLDHLAPNPQLAELIPGFRPIFASDDFLVQWRAAEAGVGAMVLGRLPSRGTAEAPLEAIDVELGGYSRSAIHLVAARSALEIPRVQAVAAELLRALEQVEAGGPDA